MSPVTSTPLQFQNNRNIIKDETGFKLESSLSPYMSIKIEASPAIDFNTGENPPSLLVKMKPMSEVQKATDISNLIFLVLN